MLDHIQWNLVGPSHATMVAVQLKVCCGRKSVSVYQNLISTGIREKSLIKCFVSAWCSHYQHRSLFSDGRLTLHSLVWFWVIICFWTHFRQSVDPYSRRLQTHSFFKWLHYFGPGTTHLVVVLVVATSSKEAQGSVVSNRMGVKFGRLFFK